MSVMHKPAAVLPAATPGLRLVPDVPLDFDDVVRRLTPRLRRYATRRLGDVDEAEELVQEALLRAYQHADALRTEDDVAAWATVVTGRLVIDRLRVRGRSVNVAEVPEGDRLGRDTADVVVARDEARMALDALDAMPGRQAAVLWAREVEGQRYDEIGARFGMSESAVRSLLSRARSSLRKEFTARGGTRPLAGLTVLAPWAASWRTADRLRSAAGRLAAPAAVGALGVALVGGALVTPSPSPGRTEGPVTPQSVSTGPSRDTTGPAIISRQALSGGPDAAAAARTGRQSVRPPAPGGPLAGTCVSAPGARAGGPGCAPRRHGASISVDAALPENPTGIRRVGATAPVRCSDVPDTPVTTCHDGTNDGAKP